MSQAPHVSDSGDEVQRPDLIVVENLGDTFDEMLHREATFDISEELFEHDPLLMRLEHKTQPQEIVFAVLGILYHPELSDPNKRRTIKEQLTESAASFQEETRSGKGTLNIVRAIVAGESSLQNNALRKGMTAFGYASDQYSNYLYRDTSIAKAKAFADYLLSRRETS